MNCRYCNSTNTRVTVTRQHPNELTGAEDWMEQYDEDLTELAE